MNTSTDAGQRARAEEIAHASHDHGSIAWCAAYDAALAAFASPVTPAAATIPEGMVPWPQGGDAPDDWDRTKDVMIKGGQRLSASKCYGERDGFAGGWCRTDIIAYTPKSPIPPATIPGGDREALIGRVARLLVEQRGTSPDTLHQFEPSSEPWPVDETQASLNWEMKPTTISLTRAWRKRVPNAEQIVDLIAALTSTGEASDEVLADAGGAGNGSIKDVVCELLSHRGERPYRILRGGQALWETWVPAIEAALRYLPKPTAANPVTVDAGGVGELRQTILAAVCRGAGNQWDRLPEEGKAQHQSIAEEVLAAFAYAAPVAGAQDTLAGAMLDADAMLAGVIKEADLAPKGLRIRALSNGIVRVRDFLARSVIAAAPAALSTPESTAAGKVVDGG